MNVTQRHVLAALLAAGLLAAGASAAMADDPSPPPWFGGRVEIPGLTLTVPDDWLVVDLHDDLRTQAKAVADRLNEVSGRCADPSCGADLHRWLQSEDPTVRLLATSFPDGTEGAAYVIEECRVHGPSSLDGFDLSQIASILHDVFVRSEGIEVTGPPRALPDGQGPDYAFDWAAADGVGVGVGTAYLFGGDGAFAWIGCEGDVAPPDRWRSIVETVELLPDAGQTGSSDPSRATEGRTTSTTELWGPASMSFSPTGSLTDERFSHAATLLADGRVLVVGGGDQETSDSLASAEIWDPDTGEFSAAGSMAAERTLPTLTTLPDGRALVIGGMRIKGDERIGLASAEVWDPTTGTFSAAGELAEERAGHSATLLPDGRILVAGGFRHTGEDMRPIASAEIWDAASGRFSPAEPMQDPRAEQTATLLPDGRILVVGGTVLAPEEIWEPAVEQFAHTASTNHERRYGHTASLLLDGRVLIVGGLGRDEALFMAEAWDPATEGFAEAGLLRGAPFKHTATVLPDGRVLIVGGRGAGGQSASGKVASAWLWDGATEEFTPTASLALPRSHHTATLLDDGQVLIVGGVDLPVTDAEGQE